MGLRQSLVLLAAITGASAAFWFSTAAARSWDDVVKAAEKEGEVVVISPPSKPHRETIMLFQKAYPNIKLKVTSMASPQWEPRVSAERRSEVYVWDVVIGGGGFNIFTKQIPAGWYQPVDDFIRPDLKRDDLWLAGWKAGYLDKGGKYMFGFAHTVSELFLVDRSQIPESQLKTLHDLTKPEFKGKIAIYDPRHRGPGGFGMAAAMTVIGEDNIRTLLTDQQPVLTTTFRQILEWSARGRYPIVIGAPISNIMRYQQKGIGTSIKPLYMPDNAKPLSPGWGGMMIFDGAPHPNATMVFANWMLGKEAQADWGQRGISNSRRLDVPLGFPEGAASAEQWTDGLALASERLLPLRLRLVEVARDALKRK